MPAHTLKAMRLTPKYKQLFTQGKRNYSAYPKINEGSYFYSLRMNSMTMVPSQGRNILYGIIGANLLVFVLWQTYGSSPRGREFMRKNFMVSLQNIEEGRIYTFITACFSHFNPAHLLFNMIGFYFFAPPVMMMVGIPRFIGLYLVAGMTGNLVYIADRLRQSNFNTKSARRNDTHLLGASGSIYSLSVFYALEFPLQTWYLFAVVPVPGIVAVGGFIAYDLFMANWGTGSRLAHTAHLGGAAVGAAYYFYLTRRLFRRF